MRKYICIILLYSIVVTTPASIEVSSIYMIKSHMTWSSANQECKKIGGSLLTAVEVRNYIFNNMDLVDLQFEEDWQRLGSHEFWIQEYKYKSPWISAKATSEKCVSNSMFYTYRCFSGLSQEQKSQVITQTNTVGTCYQRCSQFDYFSTQEKSCKCFSEREFQNLAEVNGRMCNVTCPGNVRERYCGAGVYDVYQTMEIFPYAEPSYHQSQDCDCVGLRCVNSDPVYFSDNCQEIYRCGCGIRGSLFIGPMGDWSTSLNRCVSLTGKYPLWTLDKIHLSSLCGSNLWLGVYRLTLVSKGTINCPYCRVGGMNRTDVLCNVTDCQSYRTSICRYTKGSPMESRIFTTTVSFGILIGVLIGVSSCLPMVMLLKLKLIGQRHGSGMGESAQVYFTASGNPRTSHVYEGLGENEYVEPV